jgi:protein-disulfide isomerase
VQGQQIIQEYVNNGRVKILYRHFPFIGEESWEAAEASECAAEQGKFKEYEETVYFNWDGENRGAYAEDKLRAWANVLGMSEPQFNDCMSSDKYLDKIRDDLQLGQSLGVRSTPTVFINGEMVAGLKPYGEYRVKIERALSDAGF